ncbi:PLC-like phosphodiesterase [Fomitiporia mediterranea MF3/22]|uniref:PLC-like phosphodiesterase n=1 Tax=Fomitiporia mediterranea (strain MF3/22) TaxID=694068 RepID=UPI00044098F7|nr:PLC-like phosphodiesterase [Fomitiporia mediterranea MF3/22]EJD01915.1 PLC-like phosphodiesterase [Fomitiporia mediterranea MF3/22]
MTSASAVYGNNGERDGERMLPSPRLTQANSLNSAPRASAPGSAPRQHSLGPAPGTRLKRAGNLLTPSGEATPALQQVLSASSASFPINTGLDTRETASAPTLTRSVTFGASLKRTLTEVKNSGLAIKRSLSSRRRGGLNFIPVAGKDKSQGTRHGRSLSENLGSASTLRAGLSLGAAVTADSGEVQQLRRSVTFTSAALPELLSPEISEASPTDPTPPTPKSKSKMDNDGIHVDVKVPLLLQEGTPMTKVSAKKKKTVQFRIDPDQGYVLWESKKSGIIPIENIKEIRSGADARYYREQFQLSAEYEARWLTIVYIADGKYKTLHAIATTPDVFVMWDRMLRALHAVRQELMSGLGHVEARQSVWEKRYWRGADEQRDDRLVFDEVEKLCRRLNLNFSKGDLMRRFMEADSKQRGYLDFEDFRQFVKLLKDRPELTRLYKKLSGEGVFDFIVFESFMREFQQAKLSQEELETLFRKYADVPSTTRLSAKIELPPTPPPSEPSLPSNACPPDTQATPASVPIATDGETPTSAPANPLHAPPEATSDRQGSTKTTSTASKAEVTPPELSELTMSLEAFTNFLLSTDNSAFSDQNGKIWQDMTRPLPEYFISSSHNTYLVGHQLVGVSTIEGYIRALLHSCRSVEIDIYDGEYEPVIYHGKTLTSRVPLRDICQAIAKYAFVASPYPVIISAEVHCSLVQQDLVASIMRTVFGDTLVSAPPSGRPAITELPSPEELRGRILLKAKNLNVSEQGGITERRVTVDTESSSSTSTSDTSASESEHAHDVRAELRREFDKARHVDAVKEIREEIQKVKKVEPIKEIKEELSKARNLYDRVRRKKSPSPAPARHEAFSGSSSTPSPPSAASPKSFPSELPAIERPKVKMSFELVALLVYTVGVKCRGFNKKETYAPEHVFSLSERTANKVLKQSMLDLIKHNRTHIVRIYPKGTRLNSSNYEPHRFWAAGAQLVAINWQTFDLGYMINHSMFQRNGRAGYVLKPPALRVPSKELLAKHTNHALDLKIISAQQLPRRKDSEGREIIDGNVIDPYVEVSIHVPDWARPPFQTDAPSVSIYPSDTPSPTVSFTPFPPSTSPATLSGTATARSTTVRTSVVKNNGFNPIWEETLSLPFDCVGDMFDLIFLRIAVRDERDDSNGEPLAVYCVSLGSLQMGYRHLPLHDAQLSQYLFSTLFVHVAVRESYLL